MDDLEIEPQELKKELEAGNKIFLIDCREVWEHEEAHIAGAVLIPMQTIPARIGEIPEGNPVVVICHSGQRSMSVALWLQQHGIPARSLAGGIDRWSVEIDASVPRY